jgi:hypothetical protein
MHATKTYPTSTSRLLAITGLVNGVAGIVLQYVLFQPLFRQLGMGWVSSAFGMLGFFTILTNLMVIAMYWSHLAPTANRLTRFFSRDGVRTAVTGYIVFVGVIYALFLYGSLPLNAAQQVPDAMLHFIAPPLCVAWWFTTRPAHAMHHGRIVRWLAWPMAYLTGSLLAGAITGAWLYPILNAASLGWPMTLATATAMLAFMAFVLTLLVSVTRLAPAARVRP